MIFFASLFCMKTKLTFNHTQKMSIPSIKLTPQTKSTILTLNPPKITKTFRDTSSKVFEETFVLKRLNSPIHIFRKRNQTEDGEIDVFDAEKYFNEGLNLNHIPKVATKNLSSPHLKKDGPLEKFAIKEEKRRVATPSTRSESSWNSGSKLLKNTKTNKMSFLASIGCNCSCSDKNSLDVDDYITGDAKSKHGDKIRDDFVAKPESDYNCVKFDEPGLCVNSNGYFSFPVLYSRPGNEKQTVSRSGNGSRAVSRPGKNNLAISRPGNENMAVSKPGNDNQAISRPGNENQAEENQTQEKPRKSVFNSLIKEKGKKNSLSLENNLTMFTWDEIKIPSISSEIDNDSASDASSDLFEIESFSTGNHFLSRQASGCYAPSEASVEWSVITANAADNFSIPSDCQELKSTVPHFHKVGLNSRNGSLIEIPKRRSGILSGCKSHKAVRVAGDAHRSTMRFHDKTSG